MHVYKCTVNSGCRHIGSFFKNSSLLLTRNEMIILVLQPQNNK